MSMTEDELTRIPDVGPIIAGCIYNYLHQQINIDNIEKLSVAGVRMQLSEDMMQPKGEALKGKKIVISGTFSNHSRDEYKQMIERNGGENVSSISGKTSFVLAGVNMGPSKLEKCKKLKISLVSEDEFLEMIK